MIRFEGVSKIYRTFLPPGTVPAVEDLTLDIEPGEVFGIAGPNGAGKSTLLALILGFLDPTRGTVSVGGMPARQYVEGRGVAYLSELIAVPAWWNLRGALARYATLAGVPAPERATAVGLAMERLGIAEHGSKRVKHLSKGNLQRLGLAQALLGEFDVAVFDEPTHGLDPVWTVRFRDMVAALRRPDRTIVIASHNLDELERLADRVAILDRGRLSRIADVVETQVQSGEIEYRIVLAAEHPSVTELFPGAVRADGRRVAWDVRGDIETLNAALAEAVRRGARLKEFYPARSRLEAAFRDAVGER